MIDRQPVAWIGAPNAADLRPKRPLREDYSCVVGEYSFNLLVGCASPDAGDAGSVLHGGPGRAEALQGAQGSPDLFFSIDCVGYVVMWGPRADSPLQRSLDESHRPHLPQPLDRIAQRARLPLHVGPQVADLGDAARHRPQREGLRADLAAFDLLPVHGAETGAPGFARTA